MLSIPFITSTFSFGIFRIGKVIAVISNDGIYCGRIILIIADKMKKDEAAALLTSRPHPFYDYNVRLFAVKLDIFVQLECLGILP